MGDCDELRTRLDEAASAVKERTELLYQKATGSSLPGYSPAREMNHDDARLAELLRLKDEAERALEDCEGRVTMPIVQRDMGGPEPIPPHLLEGRAPNREDRRRGR